jgi:hypothetical protein
MTTNLSAVTDIEPKRKARKAGPPIVRVYRSGAISLTVKAYQMLKGEKYEFGYGLYGVIKIHRIQDKWSVLPLFEPCATVKGSIRSYRANVYTPNLRTKDDKARKLFIANCVPPNQSKQVYELTQVDDEYILTPISL